MTSLEGPLGPGLVPPLGENSCRYFRLFSALWNRSRLDGLIMMADLTKRRGFRNNDEIRVGHDPVLID